MMSRRGLASLVVTALAVAIMLVAVDPTSAQFMRRGGSRGGFGYGYGYGQPYYSGGYSPWGYSNNWQNYPGGYYSGWGYTPGSRWSGNEYSWNTPSYYNEGYNGGFNEGYNGGFNQGYNGEFSSGNQGSYYSGTPGSFSNTAGNNFGSGGDFYGAMSGASGDNRVLITARVPPNAEVWVDDQKTTQTGGIRSFISPPLEGDRNFAYKIRARWDENGRQVEKTRRIDVHPGDRLFVNFLNPRNENMQGTSSGQSGQHGQSDRSLEHRDQSLQDHNRNRTENQDRSFDTNRGDQHNNNPGSNTNNSGTGTNNRSGSSTSGTDTNRSGSSTSGTQGNNSRQHETP